MILKDKLDVKATMEDDPAILQDWDLLVLSNPLDKILGFVYLVNKDLSGQISHFVKRTG